MSIHHHPSDHKNSWPFAPANAVMSTRDLIELSGPLLANSSLWSRIAHITNKLENRKKEKEKHTSHDFQSMDIGLF